MKKRLALLTMVTGIMFMTVACGAKNCKADDCSEEVFKKGLCEEHYYEKAFEDGLEELGNLFN